MLKCKEVTERASAYLDGELTLLQRMEYRFHLMMCRYCRRFVHNFRSGIAMVRKLPPPPVTNEQLDEIERRIREVER